MKGRGTGSYPVEFRGINEIRRTEAGKPSEEISDRGRRTHSPSTELRVNDLGSNRITSSSDAAIVEELDQTSKGYKDFTSHGVSCRAHRCSDGTGKMAETAGNGANYENPATADPMAHSVHATVDTKETETGGHDGELKSSSDTGNGEEVGLITDEEPDSTCCLACNHSITEKCTAEIDTCASS